MWPTYPSKLFSDLTPAERTSNKIIVDLSEEIYEVFKSSGLSDKQIAEKLGVSEEDILMYQSLEYNYDIETLVKILDAFGKSVEIKILKLAKKPIKVRITRKQKGNKTHTKGVGF